MATPVVTVTTNVGTPAAGVYLNAYVQNTPIIYKITVNNPGVSSTTYTITMVTTSPGATNPSVILATLSVPAGGTLTTYAQHVASSTDVTNNSYAVTTTVTGGLAPAVVMTTSNVSSTGLSVTKVANTSNFVTGTVITYSYWVRNATTNPPLAVGVTDVVGTVPTTLTPTVNGSPTVTIQPGGAATFTATYTATAADTTLGFIADLATLTPYGNQSSVTVTAGAPPLVYTKTSSSTFTAVNQPIAFAYNVTGATTSAVAAFNEFRRLTSVTPATATIVGGSATSVGATSSTAIDVADGYLSNTGYAFGLPATTAGSVAFAGMGLTLPFLGPCIHGASQVCLITSDGDEVKREIAAIIPGDHVVSADGKASQVMEVTRCWDKHPEWDVPHTCVVFPADSLGKGVPNKEFIVDTGHPISLPKDFERDGISGMMPAGWHLKRMEGKSTAYLSDWKAVGKGSAGMIVRYDLVLAEGSCGAYYADGVVVKARIAGADPGYHHELGI